MPLILYLLVPGPGIVYERSCDAGTIFLFGNQGNSIRNYIVFVCPRSVDGVSFLHRAAEHARTPAHAYIYATPTASGKRNQFRSVCQKRQSRVDACRGSQKLRFRKHCDGDNDRGRSARCSLPTGSFPWAHHPLDFGTMLPPDHFR